MRGYGQDDPDLAFCDEGEYFDIIAETCLCQPGKTPTAEVGGGCVYPIKEAGETTGDECLIKGMDFDIASKTCIPKCAPGQGRDMNGNCVSTGSGGGGGGGSAKLPPAAKPATSLASMFSSPWFIGGALLLGVVAIGAAMSKKSATPNRRYRRNSDPTKKRVRAYTRWPGSTGRVDPGSPGRFVTPWFKTHGELIDWIDRHPGFHGGHQIRFEDGSAIRKSRPNPPQGKRPPKKWMRRCVRGVKKSGGAAVPGAVCGSLWYHKMTKAQKRAAKRRSYGR